MTIAGARGRDPSCPRQGRPGSSLPISRRRTTNPSASASRGSHTSSPASGVRSVKILTAPAAIRSRPATRLAPLPLALPLRCLIEARETLRSTVRRAGHSTGRRHDPDRIARGNPVDLIAGTDAVPFGDGFRDRDPKPAGDPGHGILVWEGRDPCQCLAASNRRATARAADSLMLARVIAGRMVLAKVFPRSPARGPPGRRRSPYQLVDR